MQQHLTYFDYAATTPVRPEAAAALADALGQFGNPSSRYEYGRQAAQRLKEDRETVARALGCPPAELFFTSCGTESDNWALRRGAELNRRRGRHIVTTAIEHAAVLETCRDLEGQGYEVTYLKPDRAGQVSVEQLAAALRPDTALVSMMLVNNETGAVLPVADCVKAVKAYEPAILFHCDAVQGFLKTPAPLTSLGADLISVSGHKIGAPKGIGALYIKKGVRLRPLLTGGGPALRHRGHGPNRRLCRRRPSGLRGRSTAGAHRRHQGIHPGAAEADPSQAENHLPRGRAPHLRNYPPRL